MASSSVLTYSSFDTIEDNYHVVRRVFATGTIALSFYPVGCTDIDSCQTDHWTVIRQDTKSQVP